MIHNTFSSLCFSALLIGSSFAEDYTVSEQPFEKTTTLHGVFLPTGATTISIAPEAWNSFSVTSLVEQGALVKKGDTLIGIDTRKIDEDIEKKEKSLHTSSITLSQSKHELAQLELTTPRSLADHSRAEKQAADDLKWFTDIGMPNQIEAARRAVIREERGLSYQLEELKQLEKMYAEDQITEETEEIILIRTRNRIDSLKFLLKSVKAQSKRKIDTEIPRILKTYQLKAESSNIANNSAKEKLPRALELKRLQVAAAERGHAEATKKLAQLKADRKMMNITASTDGLVYYGRMDQGSWAPQTAVKYLKIGSNLPAHLPLLTVIPSNSSMVISAFAKETQLSQLKKGAKGYATSPIDKHLHFPVTISSIKNHPQPDGNYHLKINSEKALPPNIVPGMKATVKLMGTKLASAIVVPTSYLNQAADGSYTVRLKLADGKTAERQVTVGASNKEHSVITKGLEVAQVILK